MLPKNITYSVLKKIEDEIVDDLNAINYSFPKIDVKIEFSSLTPTKKEGDYHFEIAKRKALKELKSCIYVDSEDRKLITCLKNAENQEQAKGIIREIFGRYYGHIEEGEIYQKMEGILDIFDKVYFSSDTLGEYVYQSHWISNYEKTIDESRIILYINNIKKNLKNGKTLENGLKEVMAHEYFHVCHHYLSYSKHNYEFDEREDYLSTVVIESLAVLFEKCYGDVFLSNSNDNVVSNPYAGSAYLKKYLKTFNCNNDLMSLNELLNVGMNKWLEKVINMPTLFYKILNKDAVSKNSKMSNINNGEKIKKGTILHEFDFDKLLDNYCSQVNQYNYKRCFRLNNGQFAILIDEFDFNQSHNGTIFYYKKEFNIPYLKIVHVFLRLKNYDIKYCGSFRLVNDGSKNDVLVPKNGEELIRPFKHYFNENLLSILKKGRNIDDDSNSYYSFLIDNYKFPKVDLNDNFLTYIERILKEKGISKYRMYEICSLDRDNNKQYFDKRKEKDKH